MIDKKRQLIVPENIPNDRLNLKQKLSGGFNESLLGIKSNFIQNRCLCKFVSADVSIYSTHNK